MPRFDRTGPEGKGVQTGRRMGKCNSENSSSEDTLIGRGRGRGRNKGNANSKQGRGFGNGRGMGRS